VPDSISPRGILIDSIVRCMKPDPRAHPDFHNLGPGLRNGRLSCRQLRMAPWTNQGRGALDRNNRQADQAKTYYGQDLVARPRRLALMNMYLHGIEPAIALGIRFMSQRRRDDST